MDYCNSILYGISEKLLHELQLFLNAAAKTIVGLYKYDHIGDTLKDLHWLPVRFRIRYKLLLLVYKCLNSMGPYYLCEMLSYCNYGHNIVLNEPYVKTTYGARAFCKAGPQLWNSLPSEIRECSSLETFKSRLKTYLFNEAYCV